MQSGLKYLLWKYKVSYVSNVQTPYFSRPGGGGGRPKFRSMRDLNQPTVYGGGCPGGSCGM